MDQLLVWGRAQADLSDPDNLVKKLSGLTSLPKAIVNAAAYTKVDQAESDKERAQAVNALAPEILAAYAKKNGAFLVHVSTDNVFDGQKTDPYSEEDTPSPINVYGQTKLEGDLAIIKISSRHLIFRTSWVFSPFGHTFPRKVLTAARDKLDMEMNATQEGAPTAAEFLAWSISYGLWLNLKQPNAPQGIYNLTNKGFTTYHAFAKAILEKAEKRGWGLKLKPEKLSARYAPNPAAQCRRPENNRLSVEKFVKDFDIEPPSWEYYLDRLFSDLETLGWNKNGESA
jgi:dTDP-4-dehydrorhamnose reductase